MQHVAPGWYADPGGSGAERYWDGSSWTSRTRPTPPSSPGDTPVPVAGPPAGTGAPSAQPRRPPTEPAPVRSSTIGARLVLIAAIIVGAGLVGSGAMALYLLTTDGRDSVADQRADDSAPQPADQQPEPRPPHADAEPPPAPGDDPGDPDLEQEDPPSAEDTGSAQASPSPDDDASGLADDLPPDAAGAVGLAGPVRLTGVGGLNLRMTAGETAETITELRPGIVYEATGTTEIVEAVRWYELITPDGDRGWANGRYLAPATLDVQPGETGRFIVDGVVALNLRAEPDLRSEVVAEVAAGTVVEGLGEIFDDGERIWLRVALPDGSRGWISTRFLDRRA